MATLTTSYQKIAEKSIGTSSGGTTYKLRLYARYTSQSTSGNSTTVQVQLRHYVPNGYIKYYSSSQKITGTITASGSNATNKQFDAGEATLLTKSSTITHNQDGTKSISIGATFTNSYFGNTVTISNTSVTLPKINRLATITSAGDFTDEENPTIQFNNPAGFTVYPYLNFYDEAGTKVYGLYRNSSSATSPYTWAITDDERTAMRNATNLQQKYSVSIGVDTYNGSTKLGYNSKSYTMTYVNAEPSQSTAFTETNSKVIDVLGTSDANTIIQNVSQLRLTSTPSVKKGATVTKISFEHNLLSTDDFDSPYEHIFVPTNSKFKVTINDSRKYSIAEEYTKSIVEYVPVDISSHSFKRESPTSSNVIVNAQIRYKQATFGSNVNSPTIQWKLNEDGALTTLSSSDYIIDDVNNTIVISDLVLYDVLPYNTSGKFFLYVNDLLSEDVERAIEVPKGIPTCDMGEHDFKVNGELYVADINGQNKKEIRALVKDLLYPIGSIRVTPTNSNPSSYLGGTWTLIDKEFKSNYVYYENDSSVYPYTNISAGSLRANFGGHTLNLSFSFTLKTAISDTTVKLTTLNYSKLGISTSAGSIWINGHSDGGNASVFLQLAEDGVINVNDVVPESSVASGNTVNGFFSVIVPYNRMLDSFCDKFYWQRTA